MLLHLSLLIILVLLLLPLTSARFDTVRHSSLLEKLAQLNFNIPETFYNWILDFLQGHSHSTDRNGQTSTFSEINASIIQGSSIGPALYVVEASDLKAVAPGNLLCKYADDTYIIIPISNSHTRAPSYVMWRRGLKPITLPLTGARQSKYFFADKREKRFTTHPPPLPGIDRLTTIRILGVTITNSLSVSEHIYNVIRSYSQTIHPCGYYARMT